MQQRTPLIQPFIGQRINCGSGNDASGFAVKVAGVNSISITIQLQLKRRGGGWRAGGGGGGGRERESVSEALLNSKVIQSIPSKRFDR